MNKLYITLIALIAVTAVFAQAQAPIQKGQVQLNVGAGLSTWGFPVYLGLDFGFKRDITLGGELSMRSYFDNLIGQTFSHKIIGVLVNGNYHFNHLLRLPSKYDLYAGVSAGFYIWTHTNGYPGSHASGPGAGAQAGARYYFNDRFGINLELGSGSAFSNGKFGISYKLNKAKENSENGK